MPPQTQHLLCTSKRDEPRVGSGGYEAKTRWPRTRGRGRHRRGRQYWWRRVDGDGACCGPRRSEAPRPCRACRSILHFAFWRRPHALSEAVPGLIRLGGRHQQWLVIFSFRAPKATSADGRRYYYFTADAPPGCPNADSFGAYTQEVRKGQRVVQWTAFDADCPGPGHGTVSLVTARARRHWPGEGVSRPMASFRFTIP